MVTTNRVFFQDLEALDNRLSFIASVPQQTINEKTIVFIFIPE